MSHNFPYLHKLISHTFKKALDNNNHNNKEAWNCVSNLRNSNNNREKAFSRSCLLNMVLGHERCFFGVQRKESRRGRRRRSGKCEPKQRQRKFPSFEFDFSSRFAFFCFFFDSRFLNHLTMVQNKGAMSRTQKALMKREANLFAHICVPGKRQVESW